MTQEEKIGIGVISGFALVSAATVFLIKGKRKKEWLKTIKKDLQITSTANTSTRDWMRKTTRNSRERIILLAEKHKEGFEEELAILRKEHYLSKKYKMAFNKLEDKLWKMIYNKK